MCVTYTGRKLVAAFKSTSSNNHYLMLQETSSRCGEACLLWQCVGFGNIKTAMKQIFALSSRTASGQIRNSEGRFIDLETYLADWLKELERPIILSDRQVSLYSSDSSDSPLAPSELCLAIPLLRYNGHHSLADTLEAGGVVEGSLLDLAEQIETIYSHDLIPFNRLTFAMDNAISFDESASRSKTLGFGSVKAKQFTYPAPQAFRLSERCTAFYATGKSGKWRSVRDIGSYLADLTVEMWETEIKEPGSSLKRLSDTRRALNGAVLIPHIGIKVVINQSISEHHQVNVEKLAQRWSGVVEDDGVHIHFPERPDDQAALLKLPQSFMRFVINPRIVTQALRG